MRTRVGQRLLADFHHNTASPHGINTELLRWQDGKEKHFFEKWRSIVYVYLKVIEYFISLGRADLHLYVYYVHTHICM